MRGRTGGVNEEASTNDVSVAVAASRRDRDRMITVMVDSSHKRSSESKILLLLRRTAQDSMDAQGDSEHCSGLVTTVGSSHSLV